MLERCRDRPILALSPGETLIAEGRTGSSMYVLVDGRLNVTSSGAAVAVIDEPGAVIGEISALLDTPTSATVTAATASRVHEIDRPLDFLNASPAALTEVATTLATRLHRMVAYLADIKVQYADESGHLGLVDEVLAELTFGESPSVEPGSARDPDPEY